MRGGDCHDESRFDCSGLPSFGKELDWCQTLIRSRAWQKCSVRCLACRKPCNWPRWEPSAFWRWSSRWSFSGRKSRENKKASSRSLATGTVLYFCYSTEVRRCRWWQLGLGAVQASSPFIYVFIIVGRGLLIKNRGSAFWYQSIYNIRQLQ